jgi:aldehyde:ferredoxin oxidoreductase
MTALLQNIHAFSDSLDLCKFSAFAEGPEEYAAQFSAMTGIPFTADDVLKTGERIYNLERYYNNLAGFREGSDYLPERFLKEPSTMPGSPGARLRTRPDAQGILPGARLGQRRGAGRETQGAGDPLRFSVC